MYLWELEDSLPLELLSSMCPVPFGSLNLSITTASGVDQPFSCTSPCLDYKSWEAWWEEPVFNGMCCSISLWLQIHLSSPPSPWVEACGLSRT